MPCDVAGPSALAAESDSGSLPHLYKIDEDEGVRDGEDGLDDSDTSVSDVDSSEMPKCVLMSESEEEGKEEGDGFDEGEEEDSEDKD